MGVMLGVTRTDFYNELSNDLQREYFKLKEKKYLATIDNIYYSVFLECDSNENEQLKPLLLELENLKSFVVESHAPQEYKEGLILENKGYKMYSYCLSSSELYDIFITRTLPNSDTPRILVQIRSYGLWNFNVEKMLTDSFNHVVSIFKPYGCKVTKCQESRIDYCYHTNIICNPEKTLNDRNILKHMTTSMEHWGGMGRVEKSEKELGSILRKDYFSLGYRRSNNIYIRIYNKALEVIEMGYKQYFFEIWFQEGLINFYDKYCFEYAFEYKNYDYVHKAKLKFYLEYGGAYELTKKEFEIALNDINTPLKRFKELAEEYMPDVTTIMNIEFETKRRFYRYSDEIIDALNYCERKNIPTPIGRLFKIIDNRCVFLNYLTSKVLSFVKDKKRIDESVIVKYVSWWERLRNTKLEGNKLDEKLIRSYTSRLDERIAKVRFINTVATTAVYKDNVNSSFIEDIADVLSNLNDNHKYSLSIMTEYGDIVDDIESELLETYQYKKEVKDMRLRNRKQKKGVKNEFSEEIEYVENIESDLVELEIIEKEEKDMQSCQQPKDEKNQRQKHTSIKLHSLVYENSIDSIP